MFFKTFLTLFKTLSKECWGIKGRENFKQLLKAILRGGEKLIVFGEVIAFSFLS